MTVARPKKYHTEEERLEAGRAARRKYRQSDKGRAKRQAVNKRYRESGKGKAAMKKYFGSDKGKATAKAATKKYFGSDRGRMTHKKLGKESNLRKYGLTVEDYNRMSGKQNGCCAICERYLCESAERLCVDHDHKTGEIRGLLCHQCNVGLGYFGDNIERLLNAVEYLRDRVW